MIHYTAMTSARAALDRLCDPAAEVSAHYLVGGDGTLWQMVREEDRAWHAGAGSWQGQGDINSRSIGIELDNRGDQPFSEPQMARLESLLAGILSRWGIAADGVIGHSDMAPGRKQDPGRRFDWRRLARLGLARWPDFEPMPQARSQPANPDALRKVLTDIGYPQDAAPDPLLRAFRDRFLPEHDGPASQADHQMALSVARTVP